jgi:hypothetical protein
MTNVLDAVPYAPFVRTSDEETTRKISDLCSSLYSEATTIQSCIALFDHTSAVANSIREKHRGAAGQMSSDIDRDERITRNWPFISAREALSALYNFHWALKELKAAITETPARSDLPNPDGVGAAFDKFEKRFNKAILARHAASHRTELTNNFDKNAHKAALSSGPVVKPKGAPMMMSDCLIGRTYTGTRKGELLKFDVTWETFSAILETYNEVIASVAIAEWRPPSDRTTHPE